MTKARIRAVQTRFASRAKTGKGVGIEEAVANAEARLETMRDDARTAIDDMLETIQAQRAAIEVQDAAALALVRSHADSLGGLGEIFGMPEIGCAALSLCKLFDAAAPGLPSSDAVRVHLDALLMFRSLGPEAMSASAPAVLTGLDQVVSASRRDTASA